MKKILIASLITVCSLSAMAGVKGKVTLKGDPPRPQVVIGMASKDPLCGAALKAKKKNLMTRLYVVGKDNGLADTFVYISGGLEGKSFPKPEKSVVLDQVDCEYTPYVMGASVNQEVTIVNSDSIFHNVNSLAKAKGNKSFNIAQPIKGMKKTTSYPTSEMFIRYKCDVHPWMFAYVCVVDSPFFAVTDADGNFELPKGLPAGKYTLTAHHRKFDEVKQEITVEEGADTDVSFEIAAGGQ